MESGANIITIAVGVVFIGLGGFFLWRSLHPEAAAGKLKAMMESWGHAKGLWAYRIAYVGIPWFFGATVVMAGINGKSIAQFLGS